MMEIEPLQGTPVRLPPGRVAIRLDQRHLSAYRRLYAEYATVLEGLPVLRERDFDGRAVKVTQAQLEALNKAFVCLGQPPGGRLGTPFEAQERSKNRLFKRLQYLS
jgi:hypothetical protein